MTTRSLPLSTGTNGRVGAGSTSKVLLEGKSRDIATIEVQGEETTVWFSYGESATLSQGFKLTDESPPFNVYTEHAVSMITEAEGANEKQVLTLENVEEGTFELTYEGETTESELEKEATKEEVETALETLEALEENVSVTGEAGGPWTVEFVEGLKATDVNPLEFVTGELTPEAEKEIVATVETETPGGVSVTYSEA